MTAAGKHQVSRAETTRQGGRRPSRAGIRDVAAAAGVSITTVSDALNGKGRLPEATRRHVREVAERLGYRPSAAARTLRTGKSGLIGLTVTTYGDEPFTFTEFAYFAEMVRAATSAALARGYALVILPATSRRSPVDVWSNVALDGTVVIDPSDQDPVVTELVRQGLPVVSDGRPSGRLPVTAWVDNDHEAAVAGILDHLAEAGARRIGLLTGTSTDTYTHLSTTAYLRWCARVGQDPVYESYPAHDPCAGAVAADRLLARPDRPDAVYGLFDPNGTDLLAAARRYGLRVPEDLLLVCCSESTVYASTEPPVTTLSLKPRRIGTAVVQLLIDAIEGIDAEQPVEQVIPTELIVRASSQRREPRTRVSPPRSPRLG
ncbi:LacI family DNA-binding transcriptional regulator [Streptomyces sp. NPDC050560]|uniref:LacI family DNA-binding transcriptional regulator n=1 Tax=Streptomyces sp. NPDC050560 TaxID=3365630 RepID=UPI0037882C4E